MASSPRRPDDRQPHNPRLAPGRTKDKDSGVSGVRRKGWGNVARKGAASINFETGPDEAKSYRLEAPDRHAEQWVRDEGDAKAKAPKAGRTKPRTGFVLPDQAIKELDSIAGPQSKRMQRYLAQLAEAVEAERWKDARAALKPLLEVVPTAPSVRELHAMVLYRTGKWAKALTEFQAAHLATLEYSLHPAMMDCARALGRYSAVEELWADLKEASPESEIMSEGRIVMAATLADQGNLTEGIALLERSPKVKRKAGEHHLRTWYALADLYERSGDIPRARSGFTVVAEHDESFGDVAERLENLA